MVEEGKKAGETNGLEPAPKRPSRRKEADESSADPTMARSERPSLVTRDLG